MIVNQIRTARDLTEIIDLAGDLHAQAVNAANSSTDGHSLPGGLAMVSLAPVANMARWSGRVAAAEAAWAAVAATRTVDGWPAGIDPEGRPEIGVDEDDSWEPALQTIRFWTDHYRRVHQQDWDHTPTLVTEAKFLQWALSWIFEREPNLEHFCRDISRARVRLENVLTAGRRAERSRVVCPNLTHPETQLIRVYAPRRVSGYRCSACATPVGTGDDLDHCPNPWCWSTAPAEPSEWVSSIEDDRWKCPTCKTKYDDAAFLDAHAKQLRHASAARFVPQPEAIATLRTQGRTDRTVRSWLDCPIRHAEDQCTECGRTWAPAEETACPARLKGGAVCGGELHQVWRGDRDDVVEGYCDIATRKVWVWWPDLWRRHLSRATRRRQSA